MKKTNQTRNILKSIAVALLATNALAISAYLIINARSLHEGYLISTIAHKSVKIMRPSNHNSGGTGFPVKSPSGATYTLTNAHVCGVAEKGIVHASIADSDRFYSLRVIDVSTVTDLCLVEAMPGFTGLELADSLNIGDDVMAIGHPALLPTSLSRGRVTAFETVEILYAVNIKQDDCEAKGYIFKDMEGTVLEALFGVKSMCFGKIFAAATNVTVFGGNSGSPVVNFWGNVVGVVFAGNNSTNFGYLIPVEDVITFLEIY